MIPFEKEDLTKIQRINERIMTELRTMWGLPISDFGFSISNLLSAKSRPFINEKLLETKNDSLVLTDKGKLIADKIVLDLMLDED